MALLTDARTGLWQAVDNWPALSGKFKRTIRYDADVPAQQDLVPALSELPCLMIGQVQVNPQWATNRQQHLHIDYQMELWTPKWIFSSAELLWEEIMNALYRCKNNSNVEYVRAATGFPVEAISDMVMKPVTVGENNASVKMVHTSWKIILRTSKDPFSS